jgi:hypothetical protein
MTPKTIVYGREAYAGFANALGAQLGIKVQIDDGASACIDADGAITIPGMSNYQTESEFQETCGVIVHEMAHQFYQSHKQIDPARSQLAHDCLNAVLDVADETWVDEYFQRYVSNRRPGELLLHKGAEALRKHHARYSDWSNTATHAWKVLCVGIFLARGHSRMRGWRQYTYKRAMAHGIVDAEACFRLLRSARRSKSQSPIPTAKRFSKLIAIADKLAEILKPFANSSQCPLGTAIALALGNGSTKVPAGARVATAKDGEAAVSAQAVPGGRTQGAGGGRETGAPVRFSAETYSTLAPAVGRIAQRIAVDGDAMFYNDGLASGPRLGHAHRLFTDGQCMARWQPTENADGVAVSVLLDCSDSMVGNMSDCAGVARAFASQMRDAGPVQTLVYGTEVKPSDDFGTVKSMGSTGTHMAIDGAIQFLTAKAGKRWIVLITDGCPDDRQSTDAAVVRAATNGINVLVIGLGRLVPMSNPAKCVCAQDAARLAIELDAAGKLIEA